MEVKHCTCCKETKPLSDFPAKKTDATAFHDATKWGRCKSCNAEQARLWRQKHKNYSGSGRLTKHPRADWPLLSAIRTRLREAKTRIKKFGRTETDLTEDYLYDLFKAQNGHCALLGYEISIERAHPLALSLDQIDPGKGYIVGNVQWVTWVANRAKGDMTQDDFYRMCELAIEYRKVQRLSKAAA